MTTQVTINVGTTANDYQGDPLRTAFQACNTNFTSLFRPDGNPPIVFGTGAPTLSAAQGVLYINLSGSNGTNRIFINTNSGTGWTYLTAGS